MKKSSDGKYWWIQLNNLSPGTEYAYQYYVDGKIKIADPFTDKILDPSNDKFIPNSVPNGVPLPLWPLLWPLEFIISPIAKAFALTVRLLANMTAGHLVIMAFIGLIFFLNTYAVAPVSIGLALFIYTLELLVCFVQAFVFTMLSSLFIGMAYHLEH